LGHEGKIKIGDTLYLLSLMFFKFYFDMQGRRKSGQSFFLKDDLFFIDQEQFFMYKQDGEWRYIR
jgi:hypothetical protein